MHVYIYDINIITSMDLEGQQLLEFGLSETIKLSIKLKKIRGSWGEHKQ